MTEVKSGSYIAQLEKELAELRRENEKLQKDLSKNIGLLDFLYQMKKVAENNSALEATIISHKCKEIANACYSITLYLKNSCPGEDCK